MRDKFIHQTESDFMQDFINITLHQTDFNHKSFSFKQEKLNQTITICKTLRNWDQFDAEKFTVRIGENSYDLDGVKSVWYELGGRYEQHWFVSLLNL